MNKINKKDNFKIHYITNNDWNSKYHFLNPSESIIIKPLSFNEQKTSIGLIIDLDECEKTNDINDIYTHLQTHSKKFVENENNFRDFYCDFSQPRLMRQISEQFIEEKAFIPKTGDSNKNYFYFLMKILRNLSSYFTVCSTSNVNINLDLYFVKNINGLKIWKIKSDSIDNKYYFYNFLSEILDNPNRNYVNYKFSLKSFVSEVSDIKYNKLFVISRKNKQYDISWFQYSDKKPLNIKCITREINKLLPYRKNIGIVIDIFSEIPFTVKSSHNIFSDKKTVLLKIDKLYPTDRIYINFNHININDYKEFINTFKVKTNIILDGRINQTKESTLFDMKLDTWLDNMIGYYTSNKFTINNVKIFCSSLRLKELIIIYECLSKLDLSLYNRNKCNLYDDIDIIHNIKNIKFSVINSLYKIFLNT
jgi:hypothetical protein